MVAQWVIFPYQGRCPASIEITKKETIKKTVGQGKGTADHLMPLGDWFKILKFRQGSGPEGDDVL